MQIHLHKYIGTYLYTCVNKYLSIYIYVYLGPEICLYTQSHGFEKSTLYP